MCGVVPKVGGRSAGIRTTSLPGSTFRLSVDAAANLSLRPLFVESLQAYELAGERMFSRQARRLNLPQTWESLLISRCPRQSHEHDRARYNGGWRFVSDDCANAGRTSDCPVIGADAIGSCRRAGSVGAAAGCTAAPSSTLG